MRKLRFFFGVLCVGFLIYGLITYPIPSLLQWQSGFLAHAFFVLMFGFFLCLLRVMLGPTPADRAVAFDTIGVLIIGFCAILSIPTGRGWYLDIALAWALQSFISALALAKYLEGKGFDE